MKELILISIIASTNLVFGAPPVNTDTNPNVFDECGEGCGEDSCCIEWNFYHINDPELPYFKNLGITSDFVRKTCATPKSSALMAKYAVEGEDYVGVNMVQSTEFYMNWENFAPDYRTEYCQSSGIDPATCVNYTVSDMVEKVWGGRENAEATKYRVGPLCSSQKKTDPNPNVYDECGDGCADDSHCIEWNFFQINDPELPYFKNLQITSDFVRKTCSTPKSRALMDQYAEEGKDFVEVNMVESTEFYMNWKDFAPTYRKEYCEFSGIDPRTCTNYTVDEMVEQVWGGRENAEATKYRVGPLRSIAELSGPTTMEEWEAYCAAQDDKVEGCFEFTVSLVYTANTTCTEKAPEDSGFWWPEQTLRKPVGVCTKNVIGNTVIFECDPTKGIVNEHVYHDVLDGSVCNGTECTCESDIKYTLPIGNGCSEQFFGGMHMVWDDFCPSPSVSEQSSDDCCFRYGFGARAIPCCFETITCEEHDKLVEDSKENPIAGGAFGKHKTCPKDAVEAHRLVSE